MAQKDINFNIKINNKDLDLTKVSFKDFNKVVTEAKKTLSELPLNDPRYKILTSEIKTADAAWKEAKKSAATFNDEMQDGEEKVKSYKAQIMDATKELFKIEQQFGKNSKEYSAQQEKIKSLRDEVEAFTRGTMKLDDALGNIPGPIGQVGQAMQTFEVVTQSAQSAMGSLIQQFPLLKNAFVASGIGAIVIVIGVLVAAIMDAAKSFKPLQNAFASISDAVGALFNALKPITDFLLNVFVAGLKIVAGAINLVASALGGVNNGAKQMSLELERSLKTQQNLLDNYGNALDAKLKEYLNAYKEYTEKKKKILDDDYQDEADRQRDTIILELGFVNFLKNTLAERTKLSQEFNLEADQNLKKANIKQIDNQRVANEKTISLEQERIAKTNRITKEYNEKKLKALQDDEAVLRSIGGANAKAALEANVASQELLKREINRIDVRAFEEFLLLDEDKKKAQRDAAREDMALQKERALAGMEAAVAMTKEENERAYKEALVAKERLKERQRLETEANTLAGATAKGLAAKQFDEMKLADEKIRLAKLNQNAYLLQLEQDAANQVASEAGIGTELYFESRREAIQKGFEKEMLLADGIEAKQKAARNQFYLDTLQIDKEQLNARIDLESKTFEALADNSREAFDQQRTVLEAEYNLQQKEYQLNEEALIQIKLIYEKKRRMIDAAQMEYESSYFSRRAETEKKHYGQMFTDLRFAEDRHYEARKTAAQGNAVELELIEREHAQRMKDIKNQEIQMYGEVASAMLSAAANVVAALGSIYEAEANDTKRSIEDRKKAFETNKKYQIATATLSAAAGIIQILTQPSTLPSPFDWIVKVANAAALGISTAVQIAKINSTEFNAGGAGGTSAAGAGKGYNGLGRNYGDGGMIEGPSHQSAAGGIMINAEGGEAVMTKASVSMFGPMLSMMNQMGGGRSFVPGMAGAARPDNPNLSNPAAEKTPTIIKSYVVSTDMTSEIQKQARLKDLSTL